MIRFKKNVQIQEDVRKRIKLAKIAMFKFEVSRFLVGTLCTRGTITTCDVMTASSYKT